MNIRKFERYRLQKFTRCTIYIKNLMFKGVIVDISKGGLSFISRIANPKLLKLDKEIDIEFVMDNYKCECKARIVHFKMNSGVCGCELISMNKVRCKHV